MLKQALRFIIVLIVLAPFGLLAQDSIYFSADSEVFIGQVEQLLLQSRNKRDLDRGEVLMKTMKPAWTMGRFNKEEKDLIKSIAEKLFQLKVPVYPDFFNYFTVIQLFIDSKQATSSTIPWLTLAFERVQFKTRNGFEEQIRFTQAFLSKGELRSRNGVVWAAKASDFRFVADSALKIKFDKLNLVCSSQRDSSVVKGTSGTYDPHTGLFTGYGGKVFWWRFGFREDETFVEFNQLTINLNDPGFSADSVFFTHKLKFNQRLAGSFTDKVMSSTPNLRTTYPRFETYNDLYELPNIFPSIDLSGAIVVEGGTLFARGTGPRPAKLVVHHGSEEMAMIFSTSFTLGDNKITSDNVKAKFMIGSDSIFHPELRMRYANENRNLILYRFEGGIGEAPFSDSYHKVDLYFPALTWDIDSNELFLNRLDGVSRESSGYVESQNYFSDRDYQYLKGMDDIHPMVQLDLFLRSFGSENQIPLYAYADYIKKPSEQILTQFLRLASKGYLVYDQNTHTATVKERFFNTLRAKAGKSDYDVIRLQSYTTLRNPNIRFDYNTKDLTVYGVKNVILSDSQHVVIQPSNEQVVLKKNRDFIFSGPVQAGLFTLFARDCSFEYDLFRLNLSFIDSVSFLVKTRNTSKKTDNQRYTKVKNVLANLTGTLQIDDPGNKSGLKSLSHFPVFDSKSESYVYFDQQNIMNGTLKRDKFYYAVDPFVIDSLLTFSTDNLKFKGYLTSADIFPVFTEPLTVMDDYSLGFQHNTNKQTYPMFGGKGGFEQGITLSNKGFFGNGKIHYLSSQAISDSFYLYPDSITAMVQHFTMAEKETKVEFPRGQADTIGFNWQLRPNVVHLQTLKKPYIIFNNAVFRGKLDVSPVGLSASGLLEFSKARIRSDSMQFASQTFSAENADFHLFTVETNQEAFAALGYKVFIDFKNRVGNFRFTGNNSVMSFPFNQYLCSLDEANWIMDEDKLKLNNNKLNLKYDLEKLDFNRIIDLDLSGSQFVSTAPEQDSLSFFCLEAEYDLINYNLTARNVKIIRVADAAIFPNDGQVNIGKNAKMDPLQSATIIADTAHRYHTIHDALVKISSRKAFLASGKYRFLSTELLPIEIELKNIHGREDGSTEAEAFIPISSAIRMSDHFELAGDVHLISTQPFLFYTGGFRIIESCSQTDRSFIAFDTLIDPMNIKIPIHQLKDIHSSNLGMGFYRNMTNGQYYGRMLQPLQSSVDQLVMGVTGILSFDAKASAFRIDAFTGKTDNPLFRYTMNRCQMQSTGLANLGFSMPFVDVFAYGTIDYAVIPDSSSFDLFLGYQFPFDNKVLKIMSDSINANGQKGLNLSEGNFLEGARLLLNSEEFVKLSNDIALYGYSRKVPDELQKTLMISDVKMNYSAESNSFVSVGPIAIAQINDVTVNKLVNGYFEIEKGRSASSFSLYLELNKDQWYFFDYKNGMMQAISSSEAFNEALMAIKTEKRLRKDESSGEQYEFVISTRRKAVDFLRKMQTVNN